MFEKSQTTQFRKISHPNEQNQSETVEIVYYSGIKFQFIKVYNFNILMQLCINVSNGINCLVMVIIVNFNPFNTRKT